MQVIEQFYICSYSCLFEWVHDSLKMPRTYSISNAISKTLAYIRRVHKQGEVALKFTNFDSKNCIIYKLNKYHYLDSQLYVIDMQAFKEMAKLFRTSNNVELVQLELCKVGDQEMLEFCKANWDNVLFLSFSNNNIRKKGIQALVNGKFCQLRELSLSDNGLDADCISPLGKANWKKLEKLNLNFNSLGSRGLACLQGAKWRTLKVLSLLNNSLTNNAVVSLVRMDFPYLQQLQLSHNQLTDDCAKVLQKGYWPQLKILQLDDNFIGDFGVKQLSRLSCYILQCLHLFTGKTVILDNKKKVRVLPTMAGLKELICGNFQGLRVEIPMNKSGEVSKTKFIKSADLRDILEGRNIHIDFVSLSKANH